MLKKDTMLRFWCQKVLPLVYDDSLSYYELLNKVVLHLNQNTENINQLIDFYNTFAEDVEEIIHQMMEDGDFNEIVADTLGSIIAEEYDPTESYIIFDYCIFESKLYRANGSTTGVFDPEKWDERTVGYDLATIQNYIYTLNAGNVRYDSTETYDNGTVGKELKNLNGAINHKLDVYTTATSSPTGVPTDAEIISSIALNGENQGEFVARFDLSNGNTAFTIIWTKISANYASGLGFGYYEESGFLLRRYNYDNGTLTPFDVYTSIKNLQTTLSTPETIILDASTMSFDSGVSFHQASENTISRIGKFCVLRYSIKLTGITDSSAKNIINFFPTGWSPNDTVRGIGETGLGDGKAQAISIYNSNNNKKFSLFPVNTGTTYAIGSIAYICE